ncbi:FAD-binding oxidoreductase [Rhodovulum adriaticum]|uniref:Decaprenylphospho-beta-D-ribofuranose 2-oxidase n=1 Tax=Rhodovulum adriaticum TaxID=35804 RepID=A0A4R2NM51_RHOAD|nr:FAD-binding oxidoreductase [Rhodovulum adriaticum]MBK1637137.1 FAD-linked oxidase [Rhodovulum adriaticum]TCP22729.1 decaprenylphospho-beta-D-ribofuranose 2-oxidase [Rhodovulum adriaticum]
MQWKTAEYSGWGRALRARGTLARPEKLSALSAALQGRGPAIGNRRSYGDGPIHDGGAAIDMTRMDRLLSFDAETGVVEAEAGITIAELLRVFAHKGWMPAVMPGTGFATLGGCIANDVHGKNHHNAGSFGQHVLAVTLMTDNGPREVTLQTNRGLFRATMGGQGQTGAILSAKLQLKAIPGQRMRVKETRISDFDSFLAAFDTSEAEYTVGWIDATKRGKRLGRGILEEGTLAEGGRPGPVKRSLSVPLDAPHFALSWPVVKLFNAFYISRIPDTSRKRTRPLEDFFFPLDRIHDWNRLYGKRGFHQFQCVVPLDKGPELKAILTTIARAGIASPLAVLKKMGPGRAGHLSFPMAGYTLAVDFPARAKVPAIFARLEQQVLDAGGRLYFAKDALAHPDSIAAMYPELADWRAEVAKADPEGHLETDLVRRLKLRSAT